MTARGVAPDCDLRGLTDAQRAALGGFTGPAIRALAHLREAWCGADPENRRGVERAIDALLHTHSLREIPTTCVRVLTIGLDDGLAVTIAAAVGLGDHVGARWRSGEAR